MAVRVAAGGPAHEGHHLVVGQGGIEVKAVSAHPVDQALLHRPEDGVVVERLEVDITVQLAFFSAGMPCFFGLLPIWPCVPEYDVGAGLCPGPLSRRPLPSGWAGRPAPTRSQGHKSKLGIGLKSV